MPSNRSTIAMGAGEVLVNQTNINKDKPFYLPVGTPATEQIADENIFVSSITFKPLSVFPANSVGIIASSSISGALGATSSLNFATTTGPGFGLAVSSLALSESAGAGAAGIGLAADKQIKFNANSVHMDNLSTSQLNVSSINGFAVNVTTIYNVAASPKPVQLSTAGTSTILLPDIFPSGFDVVVTPAGPAAPTVDVFTSNYTSGVGNTSFQMNGDANGRGHYIVVGR